MDDARFDALTRTLRSRRTTLGGLLGSVVGLLGLTEAEAAPCPKGRKRCGKRCIPKRHCCTNANCRPAATGKVCRRGRCLCPPSRKRCQNRCIPTAACCGCLPGQVCQAGTCCYPTTEAFQAALAPGGPAVIQLCAGTAYRGNFTVNRNVTVIGAGATSTILNGGGTGRVVNVTSDVAVELRGVQVTNGRVADGSSGGGLRVNPRATVTLRGCLVRGNTVTNAGGGGFLSAGTLTLIDTVVSGNTAHGGGGGAASDGGGSFTSTLVLRGATRIEGNRVLTRGVVSRSSGCVPRWSCGTTASWRGIRPTPSRPTVAAASSTLPPPWPRSSSSTAAGSPPTPPTTARG